MQDGSNIKLSTISCVPTTCKERGLKLVYIYIYIRWALQFTEEDPTGLQGSGNEENDSGWMRCANWNEKAFWNFH